MTTGSDGRYVQPSNARLLSKIYHPWKFGDSISCSFWEKGWTWKNGNRPYLATGNEFSKKWKILSRLAYHKSTLKISSKSIQSSLTNRPDKKRRKKPRNLFRVLSRSSVLWDNSFLILTIITSGKSDSWQGTAINQRWNTQQNRNLHFDNFSTFSCVDRKWRTNVLTRY